MEITLALVPPTSFEDDEEYYWRQKGSFSPIARVRFIKHDPCPAFVIVGDEKGRRLRCPREELFVKYHGG